MKNPFFLLLFCIDTQFCFVLVFIFHSISSSFVVLFFENIKIKKHEYIKVIWTAAKCHDADTALRLLHEMEYKDGIIPNIITYNGVLAALGSCQRAHEAVYSIFIDQIMNHHNNASFIHTSIQPNYSTFYHLANAVATLNKQQQQQQQQQQQDTSSYYDDEEEKLALLWRIYERMDRPTRALPIGGPIIEAIITSYGKLGHYEEAKMIYNSIIGPINAGCLRAILFACSVADPPELEDSLHILHSSKKISDSVSTPHVDSIALCHTMIACSKANQWEESFNLLRLYGSQTKVSIIAMNSLIASCGRSHRCDVAIDILNNEIPFYGLQPDLFSYRNAIIACNQAEHLEKKLERTNHVKSNPMNEETDRTSSSSSSLHFQWWECAISLLQRMQENNIEPDTPTISSAISACEAAGQWQIALSIVQAMIDKSFGTPPLPTDSVGVSSSALNLYCFNAAISACQKGGAWVEALEIFERMKVCGKKDLHPNIVTYSSIILALDDAGQKDVAVTIYQEGCRDGIIKPWRIMTNHQPHTITSTKNNSHHFEKQKKTKTNSSKVMDLHHFSAAMARAAIRHYMDHLLYHSKKKSKLHPTIHVDDWIIITGKGLRSEDGLFILRPTVQQVLLEEYTIRATIDESNSGRLIVSSDQIHDVIARRSWK
jgi:pentatricopeptide repeat protein